jgi:hypothetical protein
MNKECRDSHALKWNVDLSESSILPLPINLADATWKPSDNATVRIVSVGRLVDFKAYNIGVPSVVKACLDHGVEVTWDIYGDGPLEATIIDETRANGVVNQVRLMGVLSYSEFSKKVPEYDLFVGMGTAALEAAIIGVPTVCAAVNETTRCYGYLHNLPFGNVGETQAAPPTRELQYLIREYSLASKEQKTTISKQGRASAQKYGTPIFVEALSNLAYEINESPHWLVRRSTAELYRFVTESWLAKALRRLVLQRMDRA